MGFESLKVSELKQVAEQFGSDASVAKNKEELLAILEEDGVTFEDYQSFVAAKENSDDAEDDEVSDAADMFNKEPVVDDGSLVLVKMTRANPLYEIITPSGRRWSFEGRHPFVAMPEEEAQFIFDNEEGFFPANPAEARQFYS